MLVEVRVFTVYDVTKPLIVTTKNRVEVEREKGPSRSAVQQGVHKMVARRSRIIRGCVMVSEQRCCSRALQV